MSSLSNYKKSTGIGVEDVKPQFELVHNEEGGTSVLTKLIIGIMGFIILFLVIYFGGYKD